MSTPTRQQNQAAHWNSKQAAAKTPMDVVSVWYEACRMLAKHASKNGDAALANALASHLHDFYQRHRQ